MLGVDVFRSREELCEGSLEINCSTLRALAVDVVREMLVWPCEEALSGVLVTEVRC